MACPAALTPPVWWKVAAVIGPGAVGVRTKESATLGCVKDPVREKKPSAAHTTGAPSPARGSAPQTTRVSACVARRGLGLVGITRALGNGVLGTQLSLSWIHAPNGSHATT